MTTTRGRLVLRASFAEQIEPVHPRHPDVEQQEVECRAEHLERFDAVLCARHASSLALEQAFRQVTRGAVVVDDEDGAVMMVVSGGAPDRRLRAAASIAWPPPVRATEPARPVTTRLTSSARTREPASAASAPSSSPVGPASSSVRGRLSRAATPPTVATDPFNACAATRSASPSRSPSALSIARTSSGRVGDR